MAGEGREAEVKLIGSWPSPYAMRPRIALNLKKVRYEFLEETFGAKSQLLLKSNPIYKKIPVLLHQDRVICESMIIVEYIDAVWAGDGEPDILPADPYDRAMARFWAAYIDDRWYPSLLGFAMGRKDEEATPYSERLIAATHLLEGAFRECSKGKPFFGGDGIGYVDIALGCFLAILKGTQKVKGVTFFNEETTPLLVGWAERFCAEEGVRRVMPDTDRLMEYSKKLLVGRDAVAGAEMGEEKNHGSRQACGALFQDWWVE